ncbi:hypothetical protein MHYP_G00352390 [Metynnis hypsauchen]
MIEKALSPLSFLLDLGTSKSSWSADLRDRQVHASSGTVTPSISRGPRLDCGTSSFLFSAGDRVTPRTIAIQPSQLNWLTLRSLPTTSHKQPRRKLTYEQLFYICVTSRETLRPSAANRAEGRVFSRTCAAAAATPARVLTATLARKATATAGMASTGYNRGGNEEGRKACYLRVFPQIHKNNN